LALPAPDHGGSDDVPLVWWNAEALAEQVLDRAFLHAYPRASFGFRAARDVLALTYFNAFDHDEGGAGRLHVRRRLGNSDREWLEWCQGCLRGEAGESRRWVRDNDQSGAIAAWRWLQRSPLPCVDIHADGGHCRPGPPPEHPQSAWWIGLRLARLSLNRA
jgi:hypothetical protein